MLHLLPIKWLVRAGVMIISCVVLAASYAGFVDAGHALDDAKWVMRWSSVAAMILTAAPYVLWRWLPSLQRCVFPYLGGEWRGELHYEGPRGEGTRAVSLTVRHTLMRIVLILDSDESTSRTLVVHAERDSGIRRDRLYYAYLNERKEGVPGAGARYRGLAILRIETSKPPMLLGDYFTEQRGVGKLRLEQYQRHPWWVLWK